MSRVANIVPAARGMLVAALVLLAPQLQAQIELVADVGAPLNDSIPAGLTSDGVILYFSADDATRIDGPNRELWRSDGTTLGTVLVEEINPGGEGSDPRDLTLLWLYEVPDGHPVLFFSAEDGSGLRKVWRSGGAAASTNPIGSNALNPEELTGVGDWLFFTAISTDVIGGEPPVTVPHTGRQYRLWRAVRGAALRMLRRRRSRGCGYTLPSDRLELRRTGRM